MKLAVLVSGGGTNLQAIIDSIESGTITNAEIAVVISNNPNAYALERAKAHHIEAKCVSPKSYESREAFNQALLEAIQSYQVDLVVLAGCLVVIPEIMVKAYPNKIINIHPPEYELEECLTGILTLFDSYCKQYYTDKKISYFSDVPMKDVLKKSRIKNEWNKMFASYKESEDNFMKLKAFTK